QALLSDAQPQMPAAAASTSTTMSDVDEFDEPVPANVVDTTAEALGRHGAATRGRRGAARPTRVVDLQPDPEAEAEAGGEPVETVLSVATGSEPAADADAAEAAPKKKARATKAKATRATKASKASGARADKPKVERRKAPRKAKAE